MNEKSALAFGILVGIGSLQIFADVLMLPQLKGFAAATQVSPAMKVFTAHQGYETHAARFAISWQNGNGVKHQLALDPARYANVRGPYNRRNVYGAALAYGPLMRTEPRLRAMQESVMHYAFCEPGQLRMELDVPADATHLTAHVTPLRDPARKDLDLTWEINCHE